MSTYPKIIVLPPGPKSMAIIKRDEVFASSSLSRIYPLVVDSAKGCIVRDIDGNEFIDFNSGFGVMNIGQYIWFFCSSGNSPFKHYTRAY